MQVYPEHPSACHKVLNIDRLTTHPSHICPHAHNHPSPSIASQPATSLPRSPPLVSSPRATRQLDPTALAHEARRRHDRNDGYIGESKNSDLDVGQGRSGSEVHGIARSNPLK